MAGAREPFTYVPFFFSDLFEFGYEAVGDVDAADAFGTTYTVAFALIVLTLIPAAMLPRRKADTPPAPEPEEKVEAPAS